MCGGDAVAGLELAIGAPPPRSDAERKREAFFEDLANFEPTPEELAEFAHEEDARDERLEELPLTTIAEQVSLLSHDWIDERHERVSQGAASPLAEALEIAARDCFFVYVKLRRALRGRDEAQHGESFDDHPIQNDWNGSAKVALISIDRSIVAWGVIAKALQDPDAAHIAAELRSLRRQTEKDFPNARKFRRPGFDR